jgi:hypothetical protein
VAGVLATLRARHLGVEYVMDRDGNIVHTGAPGSKDILPGWGKGAGLSNANTVGMEIIARNDRDSHRWSSRPMKGRPTISMSNR